MRLIRAFFLAALGACGGPANFAGTYSMTVVEGADNCSFGAPWMQGSSAGNIQVTIAQTGSTGQFTVGGLVGDALAAFVGTKSFPGTISGNTFTATFLGTTSATKASCMYSVDVVLTGTIDSNNNLSGTITYTPKTNADPSCGVLNTCSNQETFTGARTGP